MSVFTGRDSRGGRSPFLHGASTRMSAEIKKRGIDLLSPIWHVADLTCAQGGAAIGRRSWNIR